MFELNARKFEVVESLSLLDRLQNFTIVFIGVEGLLEPSEIVGKRSPLSVLIVVIALECRPWRLNSLVLLLVDNDERVIIVKSVGGSNETPLLADKLVESLGLVDIFSLRASKSGHPDIVSVHGPGHGVDKSRL